MGIDDWRSRIDALDSELLRLLNERARIALKVGESKKEAGASLCDHTREREVIERMCGANPGPLDDRAIVELYRAIIHESRRIQTLATQPKPEKPYAAGEQNDSVRVAFQGARGAFSESAAVKLLGEKSRWCRAPRLNHYSRPSTITQPT
jgi:chorismate mutase-like protein